MYYVIATPINQVDQPNIKKVVFTCSTGEQAQKVQDNATDSPIYAFVRISGTKPYFCKTKYVVEYLTQRNRPKLYA